MGRFDEGAAELEQAIQLDPLSPFIPVERALPLFFKHRYDAEIDNAWRTLARHLSFFIAHFVLGD